MNPRPEDYPEKFEALDELEDLPEPGKVAHVRAEDVFDRVGQELTFLLAVAVVRNGGALVLTKDELHSRVAMMFDDKFYRETGGVRILAFEREGDVRGS